MTTLSRLTPRRSPRFERFLLGLLAALLLSPLSAPAQESDGVEPPLDSAEEALELPASWPEVPGNRQTNVAPAAAPLGNLIYAFMVDREDHVLFQTFDPEADRWSMAETWTEVPGGLLTSASVAAVSTGTRLYLFAVGKSDQQVYFIDKMIGGPFEGWGRWRRMPAGPRAVAVAAAAKPSGEIAVFITSTQNKLYYAMDPLLHASWELVPGKVSTQLASGAAWDAATDTLYLPIRRSSSEVTLITRRGNVWSSPCKVPDAGTATAGTPGLHNGQLYLFSIAGNRIWAQAYGGACGLWTGRAEVPGKGETNVALAISPIVTASGADFPFMLLHRNAKTRKVKYRFFTTDDVVSEITTRGHFDMSNGRLRDRIHTRYDYGIAGRVPGFAPGTVCPEHLAIAVHGWTNPPQAGQEKFLRAQASLRQLGYTGPVVGFSWDSNTQGCLVVPNDSICGFDEGKNVADGNGPKLATFLSDLKALCPCTAIHLTAHSLGARLALSAIQALAEDSSLRWSRFGGVRIDDVHLLGAAVDDHTPQLNRSYGESIQNEVENLYNYRSSQDAVLDFPYWFEEGDDALGRDGIEDSRQAPSNYEDVEVRDLVESDHYIYWGKRDESTGALTKTGAMSRVLERFAPRSAQCLGWLDRAGCATIDGWAWNKARPRNAATVRIQVDGKLLFRGRADLYRPDVEAAEIGDGRHAFSVPIPLSLKDGQPHTVTARFADTPLELNASPRTFQCSLDGFLDAAFCSGGVLAPSLEVRGWAWDPSQPELRANVWIQLDGRLLATVPADILREDLVAAGKGDGRHGFSYSIPLCTGSFPDPIGCVTPGRSAEIRVGIQGSSFELFQSPRVFLCSQTRPGLPGGIE